MAALAADPHVADKSGALLSSWELAKEYGFTDLDGRRPDWGTFFARKVGEIVDRDSPPDEMDVFVVRTGSGRPSSTRPPSRKPPTSAPGSNGHRTRATLRPGS